MSTLVNALRVKIWIFDANSLRCCSPPEQFAVRFNQFARFATGDDAFLGPLCMREGCWFALLICVTTLSKSLLERESTYTRILTCKLHVSWHVSHMKAALRQPVGGVLLESIRENARWGACRRSSKALEILSSSQSLWRESPQCLLRPHLPTHLRWQHPKQLWTTSIIAHHPD